MQGFFRFHPDYSGPILQNNHWEEVDFRQGFNLDLQKQLSFRYFLDNLHSVNYRPYRALVYRPNFQAPHHYQEANLRDCSHHELLKHFGIELDCLQLIKLYLFHNLATLMINHQMNSVKHQKVDNYPLKSVSHQL